MTSLFVSYATTDRERAADVARRLRSEGYSAVFLDADPEAGIQPGRRWERELYTALRRSEATVFLISDASAASRWCFAELTLTRSLGRPIVPARIGGTARVDLVADVQEVDLTTSDSTARLIAALQEARVGPADAFPWDPSRSPFPGLAAFAAEDAAVFFGRDGEIDRLLELLQPTLVRGRGRWVCIVGPSGSGKSSLLQSGLLPRLARLPERWLVLPAFTPGREPTRRLAACLQAATADDPPTLDDLERELDSAGPVALRRRAERLAEAAGVPNVLLVIDQLEELATRAGRQEQQGFLRLVAGALTDGSPLWVASTMRSEFLGADPDRAGLTEVIDDPMIVGPLTRARLPDVIVRPARRAGLDLEPGLVEQIVGDTEGGDALPLLAYTLHELASHADEAGSGTLTAAHYKAVGGVVGALRTRADRLVAELSRRGHSGKAIERALLRLATVDDDGLPVRRRLSRTALDEQEREIIDAFVDARLLVVGRPPGIDDPGSVTVEVAHEALLRQWEPLRAAIDDQRDALRTRAELGREAADWEAGERNASYLLHAGRLGTFDEWADRHPGELDALEQQFLQASREAAREQLQGVRRTNRRLRRLAGGLAAVLVLALAATGFAVQKGAEAGTQADLALVRQLLAQAALLRSTQPDASLLLNVEAVRRAGAASADQARYALVDGLNRSFHVSTRLAVDARIVDAVEFAPDGQTVATDGEDGTARLWSVQDGRLLGELPSGRRKAVGHPLAFAGDGAVLATVSGSAVQLWDTAARTPRGGPLLGHEGTVSRATFSPDGTLLATASADPTLRLWNVADGSPHGEPLRGPEQGLFDVTFSPDGRSVAAGAWDGTVWIWDVATGAVHARLPGHTETVAAVLFSPDGATLYSAGEDGDVRLWDPATGSERHVSRGHVGDVTALAITTDGSTLVSGGTDRTLRLWDAVTGAPRGEPMTGHSDVVRDVAFTRDGGTVVSGAIDGSVRLWDARTGAARGGPLTGHTSRVMDIAVSPDGHTVASAGADASARLWQTRETTPLGRALHSGVTFQTVAVGDGLLVAGDDDGRVRLFDLSTGTERGELVGHDLRVRGVAISSTGVVASGGSDRTVRLWDAATHRSRGSPLPTGGIVLDVAFSRDGALVAAAVADGSVMVWSTADGTVRGRLTGHDGPVYAVAFGSGTTLVSGGEDATVRMWDAVTARPTRDPIVADDAVQDVAVSPNGGVVAAAGAASSIQFFDARTGAPHGTSITGFTGWINDIAFTPDGRTLATAADEGLQLWDVATGRDRGGRLEAGTRTYGVAFGPDGHLLASAGAGATIVWDLRSEHLVAQACGIADRSLSRGEWDSFLPEGTSYAETCGRS